jgi:CDP-paratose 2-epimerase
MRPVLVTGGAGFIGTNLADRLCREGRTVRVLDNLSRPGVQRNLRWLQQVHGARVEPWLGDVRDAGLVTAAVEGVEAVFHLAAQVAVTGSLARPRHDFEVNAGGTLNVLEAVRQRSPRAAVVYTSTNKVYGALEGLPLEEEATRYGAATQGGRMAGISEEQPLCFHSPYGCSKGAADQYVLDYARSYGLRACVLRVSCIYGPHQAGTEDQGWVAHFAACALERRAVTLYGDGKQVRDVLFAEDLVEALEAARVYMDRLQGRAFNLGGGPRRTTSLLELLARLGRLHGEVPVHAFLPWRTGDQRFYVSDTRLFEQSTGWRARTGVDEGLAQLDAWLRAERGHGVEVFAGGAA